MSHSNSHNSPVRDIDIRFTINVAKCGLVSHMESLQGQFCSTLAFRGKLSHVEGTKGRNDKERNKKKSSWDGNDRNWLNEPVAEANSFSVLRSFPLDL